MAVLYYATNGDCWVDNSGWLDFSQSECDWFGVTCNDENIVTKLGLNGNNLIGSIPTEIGLLKSLEELWLFYNDLTGTIPSEIGSMVNLESLYLNNNQLNGAIPSEVCALRNDADPPGQLVALFADCSNEDIDGRMERVKKYIPVLDETE
eukprot:scaffold8949_cov90-Skeletonema_menzelii.AAC.1